MNEEEIYNIACQYIGYDNDYEHDRDMFIWGFKTALETLKCTL